jgi:hypothetical protein
MIRENRIHPLASFCWILAICMVMLGAWAATGSAAGPALRVSTVTPDYVTPGSGFLMTVYIHNDGDEPLTDNLTMKLVFPDGVTPAEVQTESAEPQCQVDGQVEECLIEAGGLSPGHLFGYKIFGLVAAGASGTQSGLVEVSGGGTGSLVSEPFSVTAGPIGSFDIKTSEVRVDGRHGSTVPEAGSAPAGISTDFSAYSETTLLYGIPSNNFAFNVTPETLRNTIVHAPPGLLGNPTATPIRCTREGVLNALLIPETADCPADSQIGTVELSGKIPEPLYNIDPPPGSPAAFAFNFHGIVIPLVAKLRPSDYGIDIVAGNLPNPIPVPKVHVDLWGVPSDASHDWLRHVCAATPLALVGDRCPSAAPRAAFLRMPTSCDEHPLRWGMDFDTYQHPEGFIHRETTTPAVTRCEVVPFNPEFSVAVPDGAAHAPSALNVNLSLPQDAGPDGIAESDVRGVTVTMPRGMAVNPAVADGLEACTGSQLRAGVEGPATCPDASRLGTVVLTTPLLDHPIGGSLVLRPQASQNPGSGEQYRLAIVLRSDRDGINIKMPGSLKADPETGRVTTAFQDLPQLPFSSMQLQLDAGPLAPLTTPAKCGTYTAHAQLISWARPDEAVSLGSSFEIDRNCAERAFSPGFQAGVKSNIAGGFSPFTLRVTRDSGEPSLSQIDATLPEGELAKLARVPLCPEPSTAAGSCPVGSQIGAAVAGIGEGTSPLYLPQAGKAPTAVYLAGSYKGAPYSIVTAVPAQAGPFDLGQVVVRSALHIDPVTTQVSVTSDPLPQIFGGIPIAYRDVRVEVDRPRFTINPTDCEPSAVKGTISSAAGDRVKVVDRFQVTDCAALGFKPKLALSLAGRTTRSGHPALTATLKVPAHGANVARASVALPRSEFLAQAHIDTTCTRVQYAAGEGGGAGCPKGSVYGRARAFSPLLDHPLSGRVYLRSNGGERALPDLVASLDGQIHVDVVGYIDTDKKTGGIRTTFASVPDAPVSKFVLKMPGGRKSLLENSTNICRGKHRAIVRMVGQNGKVRKLLPEMRVKCKEAARKNR